MKKQTLILIFSCLWVGLKAQDISYTMFEQAPLLLNPAFAGNFTGKIRTGAIYRSQWLGALNQTAFKGYNDVHAYVDAPVFTIQKKEKGSKHWFGTGLNLNYAGLNKHYNIKSVLDLAFHLSLAKNNNSYLALGIETAYQVNAPISIILSDSLGNLYEAKLGAYTGWEGSPGLVFSHKAVGWGIQVSSAFRHLLNRYEGDAGTYRIPINYVNSVRADLSLARNLELRPMFLMQYIANPYGLSHFYFNAQALLVKKIGNKDITSNLILGLGSRLRRNAFVRVGYEYRGWVFNACYELDFLKQQPLWQSFEIGLSYIARLKKTT